MLKEVYNCFCNAYHKEKTIDNFLQYFSIFFDNLERFFVTLILNLEWDRNAFQLFFFMCHVLTFSNEKPVYL